MTHAPRNQLRPRMSTAPRVGWRCACVAVACATVSVAGAIGCAGESVVDPYSLAAASDRGDWPLVAATYEEMLAIERGDVLPGAGGEGYSGGWLVVRPEQALEAEDRVGYEVARGWPQAGEPPALLPDVAASGRVRRPPYLADSPALLSFHRAAWLSLATPGGCVSAFVQYADTWFEVLDATPAALIAPSARDALVRAWIALATELLLVVPPFAEGGTSRVRERRQLWLATAAGQPMIGWAANEEAVNAALEAGFAIERTLLDPQRARALIAGTH